MPSWSFLVPLVLVVVLISVTITVRVNTPEPSVAPAVIDNDPHIGRFDNSPPASY